MGFVFFLPSAMVGPAFEYRDYEDYINRKGDYEKLPSTLKAGFNELLVFIMTIGIYVGLSKFELFYTVSEEFKAQNILYKLGYIGVAIIEV